MIHLQMAGSVMLPYKLVPLHSLPTSGQAGSFRRPGLSLPDPCPWRRCRSGREHPSSSILIPVDVEILLQEVET